MPLYLPQLACLQSRFDSYLNCVGENQTMVLTVEWLRTTKGASKKVNFRKTIPSRTTWLSNYFLECPSGYWLQSSWLEKVHFSDDISMLGFFFWNITYFILKKSLPFFSKEFWKKSHKNSLCISYLAIATPNTQLPTVDQKPIQPASTCKTRNNGMVVRKVRRKE